MIWVILMSFFFYKVIFLIIFAYNIVAIYYKPRNYIFEEFKKFNYSYLDFYLDFFSSSTIINTICNVFLFIIVSFIHNKILIIVFLSILIIKMFPKSIQTKILIKIGSNKYEKMFNNINFQFFFSFKIFKSNQIFFIFLFFQSLFILLKIYNTIFFLKKIYKHNLLRPKIVFKHFFNSWF